MLSYLLILCLTPVAIFLGILLRHKVALPILTTIAVYFPFILELQVSLLRGFCVLVFWVAIQSIIILALSLRMPDRMADSIWKARDYSESMFNWLSTGNLPEGSTGDVVKFHLKQTLIYCLLALFTANLLSLALGSALLNYMNFYVAQLTAKSRKLVPAVVMGWNPWSIIRVFAFLYVGTVLGSFLLFLLFPVQFPTLPVLLPAILGIGADIALKLMLSSYWAKVLRANLLPGIITARTEAEL